MNEPEKYAYEKMINECKTRYPSDRAAALILIRSAKDDNHRKWIMQEIMGARAKWLSYLTIQQRTWQTKVSRRPWKGNHHDSWAMRESYMHCSTEKNYGNYLPYAHTQQILHGWKISDIGGYPCRGRRRVYETANK